VDALVENALAYGSAGGEVEIRATGTRLEVLDRGPGPQAGEEEAVFERFRRGSAGRRGPAGTGLGLPIARELARRWGGSASLGAREGGGARATLEMDGSRDFAEPLHARPYRRRSMAHDRETP
jgi:signal transduction histidine kinase